MVQQESLLNVADNTGAKKFYVLEFLVEHEEDMLL